MWARKSSQIEHSHHNATCLLGSLDRCEEPPDKERDRKITQRLAQKRKKGERVAEFSCSGARGQKPTEKKRLEMRPEDGWMDGRI